MVEIAMATNRRLAGAALLGTVLGTAGVQGEDLSHYTGAQLFGRFCASCHGRTGEGNGPVAPFFKLSPPDLTLLARRRGGDFPADRIFRIIDGRTNLLPHGSREMPIWGLQFAMAESRTEDGHPQVELTISRLVDYLRAIQRQ
jgi:mono/diheme cytochrome c family protein